MSTIHFFDASAGAGNLGDLEKTIVLNNLMETALEDRDSKWIANFLSAIDEANLKLGDPEVIMSNDGFPYFNLKTIEEGENFQAFVIKHKLETILGNGFGISINAHKANPDWIFTYGDLANLQINQEFYTDEHLFSENTGNFALGKDEQVLVGQPSEAILPTYIRQQLREFLAYNGVKMPKIMLIARNYEDDDQVSQDLVINVTPKNFANEKDYQTAMNSISWFLPRHYSIVGMDEDAIPSGFEFL